MGVRSWHYRSLDLWRGVACLAVIVFHLVGPGGTPTSSRALAFLGELGKRGWAGVPLFFVISGYCIAASASRPNQTILAYFARRLRRIFPPLWIFLAGAGVLVSVGYAAGLGDQLFGHTIRGLTAIEPPTHFSLATLTASLTLTKGWLWRLGGPFWRAFGDWWLGQTHLWSLGFEEQFYVVVGVLVFTCGRYWWRGAEVLTAAIAVHWWVDRRHLLQTAGDGFFFDGYWLLFALGMFVFHHHVAARGVRRVAVPVVVAALGLAMTPWLVPAAQTFQTSLAYGAVFTALLLALLPIDAQVASHRLASPLAWIGRRCYSVYLLHWPVTKAVVGTAAMLGLLSAATMWVVVVPAGIALSLLVAAPFHTYVERRFMNRSVASSESASRTLAVGVSVL